MFAYVVEVGVEASFELRESLHAKVEVANVQRSPRADVRAAILPSLERGQEIQRRCELDVHVERLLEVVQDSQDSQELVGVRLWAHIDAAGGGPPADDDRTRAADQIQRVRPTQTPADLGHQLQDAIAVDVRAHGARPRA